VLTARRAGEDQLSAEYVRKIIATARRFFSWLSTHQKGYRAIDSVFADTLKPPRMFVEPTEHEAVTLEEVRAIASAPAATNREKRIRAATVFLFLSGMRIGAFVTMPLNAVDLDNRIVKQWPSLGVRTKFRKHATTFLLNIPDLLPIVYAWDEEIRASLPPQGLWFAHFSPETGEIDPDCIEAGKHRDARARKDLKDWLNRIGLPYHSPHKFRHGHAVFALKQAQTVADLKAASQNLMHSDLKVADGVYGVLSSDDVAERIAGLGSWEAEAEASIRPELVEQIAEAVAERLRER
jgi:integrase